MKTNLLKVFLVLALVLVLASGAAASSFTFSASQVKSVMSSYGAPLSDSTNLWGLWAVRTMPIVTGGTFTITGGSTTQTGWEVSAPSTYDFGSGPVPYSWPSPYGSNCAWFADTSGSEAGYPPNPLYMIINQPASSFESYIFEGGVFVGPAPIPGKTPNTVTAVNDSSTFTVNFTLGSGASWDGAYQFVVDGTKYNVATPQATWNEDFFGGYGTGGGLTSNMGAGYSATPLPGSLLLLGSGLVGLGFLGRRKLIKRS